MSIKDEIKSLIRVLQDQLTNFDNIPDERLESFLQLCIDNKDNYSDERIQTRELEIVTLCMEADVRSPGNIGHCGEYQDYVWRGGEWVSGEEGEEDEEEENED